MNGEISKYAKFCECPNCKTIDETAWAKEKITGSMSLPIFLLGLFLSFMLLFLFAYLVNASKDSELIIGMILGCFFNYLWTIYFTTVHKQTITKKACPRCGYFHIILLSEDEYKQKANS